MNGHGWTEPPNAKAVLEVVFGDSAKGTMKVAKRFRPNKGPCGPTSFFGSEIPGKEHKAFKEKFLAQQSQGEAVGGDPQDVVSIGFALDIGDISGALDSEARKGEYVKCYEAFRRSADEVGYAFENIRRDFERLLDAARSRQPIRIWKSNKPSSACGFAFVCHALSGMDCVLSAVTLPDGARGYDPEMPGYTDWGEVHPGQLYQFLPLEQAVSAREKEAQGLLWQKLIDENAPLRATVNGLLMSVPEDFYDPLILRCMPAGDFHMGRLIGDILSRYPIGVSDVWYALRIRHFIAEGRIRVVEEIDPTHPYMKILRQNGADTA